MFRPSSLGHLQVEESSTKCRQGHITTAQHQHKATQQFSGIINITSKVGLTKKHGTLALKNKENYII
jgi:hypothetical protein